MSTEASRQRILYIAHRVPYPPNKGDKIRSYNILRHLAERFDTSLATLIDDAGDAQWLPKLESHTSHLVYARIDQWGRKMLSARALLEGRSISQCFFYSQTLQDRIDSLLDDQRYDVILCSSSPMAEYLFRSRHFDNGFGGARRVIDLIDVDSHKWLQYAETAGPVKSWVYTQEARHRGNFERRIYEYFDKLVLVSDQEKQYFPGGDSASKIVGVPNGVDLEYFHPKYSNRDPEQPPTLIFCGMMDYWPNIEGVIWFVERVFNKIRAAVPEVQFFIVGGRPTKQVLELNSIPGVTVTGFVDDVREYTGKADVCVVPLRIARGIQNKVLEAMAMQKAIVSTPQALEGILARPHQDLAVEEDPEEFAEKTIQLLRDSELNDRLARNARACVESSYVWTKNLSMLDHLLLDDEVTGLRRNGRRIVGRLKVPVRIQETHGLERRGEPLRIGLPIERSALDDTDDLAVIDEAGSGVPFQYRILDRWPDATIKWVLLDLQLHMAPDSSQTLYLTLAEGGIGKGAPASPPRKIEDREKLRAGNIQLEFTDSGEALVAGAKAGERQLFGPSGLFINLQDAEGRDHRGVVRRACIEDDGPVRTTVVVEGDFSPDEQIVPLEFTATLSLFSETSLVMVELDLHNPRAAMHPGNLWDLGDPGSCLFLDMSLVLDMGDAAKTAHWYHETGADPLPISGIPWVVYQDSSGGENWDSSNHVNANGELTVSFRGFEARSGDSAQVLLRGDRVEPIVVVASETATVAATVADFWQNFPSAIRCKSDSISIGLFPDECVAPFELQGGERKRHVAWLDLGAAEDDRRLQAVGKPLSVVIDAEWLSRTRVLPYFLPADERDDANYRRYVESVVQGEHSFFDTREVVDEYGWRNFGDLYADHEAAMTKGVRPLVSHYNNQYDFVHAAAMHYLRTGDARWRRLMTDAARHTIDIDIYHTDQDRPAYNGGMFWHTDHYKDAATATHRTYSSANGSPRNYGGGPSNEHLYTSGLLSYYFLTGDRAAREAVIKLAEWVINTDDGSKTLLGLFDSGPTGKASSTAAPDYHKAGRGAGNAINALLDGWVATRQQRYLEKAQELIVRCTHPADAIDELGLDEPETRWSYLVFLQVIGKFLDIKLEQEETDYFFFFARDSLTHYATWMLSNETPYKEVLDKVDIPSETWPAQDIRKSHIFHLAARNTAGDQRERFAERAQYFFRRCIDDLLEFETAYYTRPRVIISAFGHIPLFFETVKYGDEETSPFVRRHNYDFGDPVDFKPQGARIGTSLRGKLRIFLSEMLRLMRERSGFNTVLAKLQRRKHGKS